MKNYKFVVISPFMSFVGEKVTIWKCWQVYISQWNIVSSPQLKPFHLAVEEKGTALTRPY